MSSPLGQILNSINNKGALLSPEFIEKEYSPYVINRSLSYFIDTVLFAQELDRIPDMPVYDQYLYYYHSVRRGKRFAKWVKPSKDKYLKAVKEFYGFNTATARNAMTILSDAQLKAIVDQLNEGGRRK